MFFRQIVKSAVICYTRNGQVVTQFQTQSDVSIILRRQSKQTVNLLFMN